MLPAIEAYFNHKSLPGLCTWAKVGKEGAEWAPGAYIEAIAPDVASIQEQADWLVRSLVAFHAQFAPELREFLQYLKRPETPIPEAYNELRRRKPKFSKVPILTPSHRSLIFTTDSQNWKTKRTWGMAQLR